ncbi:hybrid sensor histidine kinase/response regulator [Couchioplanes azureus]|uniref:hybrid sensor histidine kinase/response regulator n=1 Tax=Couchioplanes caeruleus TaxID=56438 RepID=UPI0016700F30|nr:response regulator [Couchioplanes caeruleus]GGQ47799.1 hypothetical protein GCM10010166_14860 [Couchioplanes caeruleus subsp. azureus]
MATILVVDDRTTSRAVAHMTLDDGGHQVIEAREGRQALEIARRLHPDVVLTDVIMPGMGGYEFVHELRADASTADIPVLLYTANYLPEEAAPLASAYGVSKVVPKSADPAELLAAVEQALHDEPAVAAPPTALAPEHLWTANAKLVEKVLALDESEARFGALADVSPVGIVSGTMDLRATYANPRLTDITAMGTDSLLGHGWLCCLPEEHRDQLRRRGIPDGQASFDGGVTVGDGQRRWLHTTVRLIEDEEPEHAGFVATVDDVTALVEAEQRRHAAEREREIAERRRISERFDSLARLSGAIAHDFNNILNIILSFSEFTQEALREAVGAPLQAAAAEPMLQDLDHIHRAGRRAAHLAHQLLTFGGREVVKPTVLDPNTVVEEVRRMAESAFGTHVTITTRLDPRTGNTVADGSQLTQVLYNLAVNARDAMPHGGHLTLETRRVTATEQPRPAGLPAGDYVHIAVRDDGDGMTPDVLDHAVEPFFTTKPKGQGTGLGLATAFGIVRQAAGDLTIDSAPGRGTTVNVYLPATEERVPASTPPAATDTQADRTILVADDEDGVREVACRILARAGYTVLPASNGQEALDIARDHTGAIHALLSDVVMPQMNGPELAAALQDVRPGTPVLYMSGYADPLMNDQGTLDPDVTIVGKPFTRNDLLAAVEKTLRSATR